MSTVFEESDYDGERFAGLVADGVVVTGVRFAGCRFEKSSFQEATFRSCAFDDCSFSDCNLSLVTVVESRFGGTAFTDCKVTAQRGFTLDHARNVDMRGLSLDVAQGNPITETDVLVDHSPITAIPAGK